jgi:hypothetical protein
MLIPFPNFHSHLTLQTTVADIHTTILNILQAYLFSQHIFCVLYDSTNKKDFSLNRNNQLVIVMGTIFLSGRYKF